MLHICKCDAGAIDTIPHRTAVANRPALPHIEKPVALPARAEVRAVVAVLGRSVNRQLRRARVAEFAAHE